jgi:hypothetical protein
MSALCFPGAGDRALFCWISKGRMPSATAKVYRIGQGSGQRNHAKAGLLFPHDGHFRMASGVFRQNDPAGRPHAASSNEMSRCAFSSHKAIRTHPRL